MAWFKPNAQVADVEIKFVWSSLIHERSIICDTIVEKLYEENGLTSLPSISRSPDHMLGILITLFIVEE
jgi:hypothetical protein